MVSEPEAGQWQRHVTRRCPNMRGHMMLLLQVPCSECYSLETFWRPIPYEPDARSQVEPGKILEFALGKADWLWDEELQMHVPCCSQSMRDRLCHNGPLVGEAVLTGDCGEMHARRQPS